jgi:2-polyprenyl-3-methyl-5-hydroxy-6-metoxy-1,4-benzoquinol methylase
MVSKPAKYAPISCLNCGAPPEQHLPFVQTQVTHHGHMQGDPLRVVVCPTCGLVFLNPQPTREALDQFYSTEYYSGAAPVSDAAALTAEKIWQRDFLFTWLVENLPEKIEGWDILDIGAGYGTWLQWFDKSNRVAGIESSQQACQVARSLFGLTVYKTDFLANDLPGGQFELVTGLAIIEHFNDPLGALVEMNRLLKPGGYLYLQTPDIHGMVLRQGIARYFKVVHTFYYSLVTLSSLLAKAGLELVASRRRPPLVDTSGILFPDNYWSGELDILAVKRVATNLEDAQHQPHAGCDRQAAEASLESALQRDRFYLGYARLYRMKGVRVAFKALFRLAKRMDLPPSIFEEQAKRLGLGLDY